MGVLAQLGGPAALLLLGLALVIALLLMRSHRYFSRQDRSPIVRAERPQPSLQGPHGAPPDGLSRWEVRMHETARDLSAQLDSKMGALEHLVREADRAAARLEKALAAAGEALPEVGPAPPVPDRREEICTLADYGLEPSEIARRLGTSVGDVESILQRRAEGRAAL